MWGSPVTLAPPCRSSPLPPLGLCIPSLTAARAALPSRAPLVRPPRPPRPPRCRQRALSSPGCPCLGPSESNPNPVQTPPPTQGPVRSSSRASLVSPGLTRGRSVCHVACCPHPPPRAPRGVLTLCSSSGGSWHQLLPSGPEDSYPAFLRLPGQPLTLGLLQPPGAPTHTERPPLTAVWPWAGHFTPRPVSPNCRIRTLRAPVGFGKD